MQITLKHVALINRKQPTIAILPSGELNCLPPAHSTSAFADALKFFAVPQQSSHQPVLGGLPACISID